MKHLHWLALAMLIVPTTILAVVIKTGVPDSTYLVPESTFPALVDLPGDGHGALIKARWVVTSAHTTQGDDINRVRINGKWREISHIYLYPGFEEEYALAKKASEDTSLKNWPDVKVKMGAMHDIALIELAKPVEDVKPFALYRQSDELGQVAKLVGKGATGNGKVGTYPDSSHRGKLRRAYNRITRAHAQWLNYRFDCGSKGLPLEGVLGSGDSGGPLLVQLDGQWRLAGLADWKHWPTGRSEFAAGVCGQEFSNSRISYYAKWIDGVIAAQSKRKSE